MSNLYKHFMENREQENTSALAQFIINSERDMFENYLKQKKIINEKYSNMREEKRTVDRIANEIVHTVDTILDTRR